jgi:ABC-type glutathione transport system ATPase component
MSAPPTMAQTPDVAPPSDKAKPPHVTIRGLSKHFDKTVIYDNFDLDIPRGELISVFGPNGCGKSTLINMIAGLVPAHAGQILFDGRKLAAINFGYVFQNYREALFPWMRAFDNIAYPLKLKNVPPAERRARTEKLVEHLGIKLDLALYPLSDVRRTAAARLDPARARGRAGNPLSRRTVLGARLRDDAVHARAIAADFFGDRHHHDPGVA